MLWFLLVLVTWSFQIQITLEIRTFWCNINGLSWYTNNKAVYYKLASLSGAFCPTPLFNSIPLPVYVFGLCYHFNHSFKSQHQLSTIISLLLNRIFLNQFINLNASRAKIKTGKGVRLPRQTLLRSGDCVI